MRKTIKAVYVVIRELLWPCLEGEVKQPKYLTATEIIDRLKKEQDKDKINSFIEMSKEIAEREEKRRSTVEAKATTLIGATGFTITIIVSFGKPLFFEIADNSDPDLFSIYIFSFFFLLSILYFSRSILFSLKALSRKGFHTLKHKDVIEMEGLSATDYIKKIAGIILENTSNNYRIVNEKVDWMVMSQEYFKRGAFSIIIVALILAFKVFIHYLSKYINLLCI